MKDARAAPIGVFDSGIGGWSVLREIRRELPRESLLYLADSGYAPYGGHSNQYIAARAHAVAGFLIEAGAKALVVACNTATSAAAAALRARFDVPIVAMEPAVKPAAAQTRSGVIGVLATERTIDGEQLARLRDRYGRNVTILSQACPGLVEHVEAGDFHGPDARRLVDRYVRPLLAQGADVLVLGCTHYPLLRTLIEEAARGVAIIDPAPAVARELRRRLDEACLLSHASAAPPPRVYTTGPVAQCARLIALLDGVALEVEPVTLSSSEVPVD